jgi:hypothetical protein
VELTRDESAVKDIYSERLKGMSMCMDILSRCLRGDFFNVGILMAFNDTTAVDLIHMILQLIAVKLPLLEIIVSSRRASFFGRWKLSDSHHSTASRRGRRQVLRIIGGYLRALL